jgi:hypothetical protein
MAIFREQESRTMPKKKAGRQWTWAPSKRDKPTVPDKIKAELESKAEKLVEEVLTPKYIEPPPKNNQFNYPIKIWTKWHKSFFYFTSTWASPGPNRIAPTFELPFARLEYTADGCFNLAYFRHTEKWFEIHRGLTMADCLELIADGEPFSVG